MGAESFTPVGIAIDAATELFKLGYGGYQVIKGNKGLKDLERPYLGISPEIQQNRDLAGQIASQGYSDSAKNFATDSIERGLGSTISSAERTGQGLNSIQSAYSSSTDAFRNLLAMDAQQKLANQGVLMSANKDLADDKLRAWDYNVNQPFQTAFQKYTQMTNSGVQNIFGGAKGVGSALTSGGLGGGDSEYDLFKKWKASQGDYGGYQGSINTGNIG